MSKRMGYRECRQCIKDARETKAGAAIQSEWFTQKSLAHRKAKHPGVWVSTLSGLRKET